MAVSSELVFLLPASPYCYPPSTQQLDFHTFHFLKDNSGILFPFRCIFNYFLFSEIKIP